MVRLGWELGERLYNFRRGVIVSDSCFIYSRSFYLGYMKKEKEKEWERDTHKEAEETKSIMEEIYTSQGGMNVTPIVIGFSNQEEFLFPKLCKWAPSFCYEFLIVYWYSLDEEREVVEAYCWESQFQRLLSASALSLLLLILFLLSSEQFDGILPKCDSEKHFNKNLRLQHKCAIFWCSN